jgi:hypothetical protein
MNLKDLMISKIWISSFFNEVFESFFLCVFSELLRAFYRSLNVSSEVNGICL